MCTKECSQHDCPFAFTEESEVIQNYGCIPAPFDIIKMRVNYGKTWACHSDDTKPCLGALKYMKEERIECRVIDKRLVTDSEDWTIYL